MLLNNPISINFIVNTVIYVSSGVFLFSSDFWVQSDSDEIPTLYPHYIEMIH